VGLTTVGHVVSYVEKRLGKLTPAAPIKKSGTPLKAMKQSKPSKPKSKKKS
jgi:hypothetical protein